MPPPAAPKPVNVMIDLQLRDFYAVVIGGTLLSANAGFINAATMIGLFSTTVSHVTGTTTRFGVTLVQNKWDSVLREATILLSFMFGSFVCGIMIRSSKFRLSRRYGLALLVECGMLLLTTFLLYLQNYLAPIVAAFACGLQNGLTTGYSGAIIRTTHVTGTATDIGLIIGQNLLTQTRQDLWKLKVLVPLLVGYFIGGVFGTLAYETYDYLSFLFPTIFVGLLGSVQIIINWFWLVRDEVHEKDLRLARARARRAAKQKIRTEEAQIVESIELERRQTVLDGAEVIELSAVHEEPDETYTDDRGIVPLVKSSPAPRVKDLAEHTDDEDDDDDDDHDPTKKR